MNVLLSISSMIHQAPLFCSVMDETRRFYRLVLYIFCKFQKKVCFMISQEHSFSIFQFVLNSEQPLLRFFSQDFFCISPWWALLVCLIDSFACCSINIVAKYYSHQNKSERWMLKRSVILECFSSEFFLRLWSLQRFRSYLHEIFCNKAEALPSPYFLWFSLQFSHWLNDFKILLSQFLFWLVSGTQQLRIFFLSRICLRSRSYIFHIFSNICRAIKPLDLFLRYKALFLLYSNWALFVRFWFFSVHRIFQYLSQLQNFFSF